MILVKTPKKGETKLTCVCKCVACGKPILSVDDGNVLFDMEKSFQEESEAYFVHKKRFCMDKVEKQVGKRLESKDLREFFAILSS